jgi:hypothetical protein
MLVALVPLTVMEDESVDSKSVWMVRPAPKFEAETG